VYLFGVSLAYFFINTPHEIKFLQASLSVEHNSVPQLKLAHFLKLITFLQKSVVLKQLIELLVKKRAKNIKYNFIFEIFKLDF